MDNLARNKFGQASGETSTYRSGNEPARSMNILALSTDPRVLGGITTFMNMVIANLNASRVTLMPVGSLHDQSGDARQSRESILALLKRIIFTPLDVARRVKSQHYDVVHLNPPFKTSTLVREGLILLALRANGYRRTLVYFHGWRVHVARVIRYTPGLKQFVAWVLNGTGHIMVLAPEFKNDLVAIGVDENKITVTRTMFDGVALKDITDESAPAHQRRRTVLYMSRFVREKGIYELLEAFARLRDEFADVDLVMAGDGDETPLLKAKAEVLGLNNRASFPGYVVGEAKWRLLRDCTLFALPTYFPEGMPVALLEAMGAGKPLLTADAGGIHHVIAEPDNGIVLPSVSVDAVERALRELLSDPTRLKETGQRNRDYAWRTFEARSVTAEIETIYRNVARIVI
jgi:glycosyltransferase involved in cell wall biosynthesis